MSKRKRGQTVPNTPGERIKNARLALNPPMKRADFAIAVGESYDAVMGWEAYGVVPAEERRQKICDVLGITMEHLMQGKKNMPGEATKAATVNIVSPVQASALRQIAEEAVKKAAKALNISTQEIETKFVITLGGTRS